MGNSGSSDRETVTDEQVEEFCKQCRPLDLLVFRGSEGVSKLIRKLQKKEVGSGDVSHVEVVITPEWCDRITKLSTKFKAFPSHESFKPHPRYLLSWGSTLSGKLNDGVNDGETGKVKFGVQVRDLKLLVKKYASKEGANVGVCRLKFNPTGPGADPTETMMETDFSRGLTDEEKAELKKKIGEAYDRYHESVYNFNILDLLASLYPELRPTRDRLHKILRKHFLKGKDEFLFCSEFAASLYQDLGIINDATDGKVDGEVLEAGNVVPVDFLGHDTDVDGIRVRLCEEPIWIKPLEE